jgi:rubrerythrin
VPCYGTGPTGELCRGLREYARGLRLVASGAVTLRCGDCARLCVIWRANDPPEECPACGTEPGDRWHEITEG